MKFRREQLLSILWGEEGEIVRNEIIGTSRWSIHHELIFKHEGKLYLTIYSSGATEMQDESPWEFEDEVECEEVEAYEKTITDYRKV